MDVRFAAGLPATLLGLIGQLPGKALRGTADAVTAAGEAAAVTTEVAASGVRTGFEAAASVATTVWRAAADRKPHWQDGRRFHLPLDAPRSFGSRAGTVLAETVAAVRAHPDVLVAYWDGGLARLVVQVAEDAATDRVAAEVAAVAERHGLGVETDQPVAHPGDLGEVRKAAAALVLDAAGLATALTARALPLRRPPRIVDAALTIVREDPRVQEMLRSALGASRAEYAVAVATAAVGGAGLAPADLMLDGALQAARLAQAAAGIAAFRAVHDRVCLPERVSVAPGASRPAVPDELRDYAAAATTGSLVGAVATAVFRGDFDEAAAAVLAGSPKPARHGWTAYQAGLSCALAREGVLVRDPARLRLLQCVDTFVVQASALHTTRRTVLEAGPSTPEWGDGRLWHAAEQFLTSTDSEIRLRPARTGDTGVMIASAGGRDVGTVLVGYAPEPLAETVLDAAGQAGLRVVVVNDGAVGDRSCTALADQTADAGQSLEEVVAALHQENRVVLTVGRTNDCETGDGADGILRGDLAVSLADGDSAVVWTADLVCTEGLGGVWRLLRAVEAARRAGRRAKAYAEAAAALSGLLVVAGGRRRWARLVSPLARISPVNLAAGAAQVSGWQLALQVAAAPSPVPRPHVPWHALTVDEVLRRLDDQNGRGERSRPGLQRAREAFAAVAELPAAAPFGSALRLAGAIGSELNDPLTPVLAVGAAASAILGSTMDALLVLGAMGVNASVGGVQRMRAERALAALADTQKTVAACRRNDQETRIVDAAGLARGDVIEVGVGSVVPADARLLEMDGLEVDESALTGESLPVAKQLAATPAQSIAERRCMVFEGTTVVAGWARAVVVDTGEHTETGRAVALAARTPPSAGVQARLRELTSKALPLTLAGGAAVTGLSLLRGRRLREAISGGVAVAVAAVPEGLPLVATVAQMAAARRLSRHGILVRTARTLEALGRVDTVCFDKTGTLTENRLRVVAVATADAQRCTPDDPAAAEVLRAAARACPRAEDEAARQAHATDDAVLAAAVPDEGWEQIEGLPFEASRGYAAAVGSVRASVTMAVKGAPEAVLPHCTDVSPATCAMAESLAAEGLRVLAVAQRPLNDEHTDVVGEPLEQLRLLGFVALADAPRTGSASLVRDLRDRGVDPVMLTGDHPRTALAIATSLGWPSDTQVVTGAELAALDRDGRAETLREAGVVARVAPEQKLQVVEALRAAGRVVAMVGDGANDAAAIRAADVGIGVSARGSSAARNAADLVVTDGGDLAVLVDAVSEGRALWRSVADAISILIGGNAGEVGFTVLGTLAAGRSPLSTRQLLLVNLLTDMFPAMSVAVTPADDSSATGDPADHPVGTAVLGAPLGRQICRRGIVTGAGASTSWLIGTLTPGTARRTSTMALCGLVGAQLAQTLSGRLRSPLVLATSLGSAAVLAAVVQTPGVSHFFGCTPLGPLAWAGVGAGVATAATSPWWSPPLEQLTDKVAARLPAITG